MSPIAELGAHVQEEDKAQIGQQVPAVSRERPLDRHLTPRRGKNHCGAHDLIYVDLH